MVHEYEAACSLASKPVFPISLSIRTGQSGQHLLLLKLSLPYSIVGIGFRSFIARSTLKPAQAGFRGQAVRSRESGRHHGTQSVPGVASPRDEPLFTLRPRHERHLHHSSLTFSSHVRFWRLRSCPGNILVDGWQQRNTNRHVHDPHPFR